MREHHGVTLPVSVGRAEHPVLEVFHEEVNDCVVDEGAGGQGLVVVQSHCD